MFELCPQLAIEARAALASVFYFHIVAGCETLEKEWAVTTFPPPGNNLDRPAAHCTVVT